MNGHIKITEVTLTCAVDGLTYPGVRPSGWMAACPRCGWTVDLSVLEVGRQLIVDAGPTADALEVTQESLDESLATLELNIQRQLGETQSLRDQVAALEAENAALKRQIAP